jgi:hypothetical protein
LSTTDALWKFVVFITCHSTWASSTMRCSTCACCAALRAQAVDVVLSGHEHNYQRPRPIRFTPCPGKSTDIGGKDRRVAGSSVVDRVFDGHERTRPDGVLYIVTGAGGKHLPTLGLPITHPAGPALMTGTRTMS